jgi:hypothetical protein
MTVALTRHATTGRHRAPEPTDEPRWATPAEFAAAWTRVGRHAAPESPARHAADGAVFDWLRLAPAAG